MSNQREYSRQLAQHTLRQWNALKQNTQSSPHHAEKNKTVVCAHPPTPDNGQEQRRAMAAARAAGIRVKDYGIACGAKCTIVVNKATNFGRERKASRRMSFRNSAAQMF
ncbi:hypothetical protein AMATHDRAFT_5106 [Amanita thiersii Skay4041]|uniref:Uncharacterized protein n=1 Tax=Amanita thiersii Skay4041 TaxID=703135 RepID=A0A2A9NN94_9AGAR|nr:hypothetical protein AMATHDRAFT_5106 [Amanita thiersii Skay4041]